MAPADPHAWQPCPSGELHALQRRVRGRRNRRKVIRSATAALAVAGSLVLGGYWLSQPAALNHSEVLNLAEAYSQPNGLTATQRAQVERHLQKCAPCREHYRQLGYLSFLWDQITLAMR